MCIKYNQLRGFRLQLTKDNYHSGRLFFGGAQVQIRMGRSSALGCPLLHFAAHLFAPESKLEAKIAPLAKGEVTKDLRPEAIRGTDPIATFLKGTFGGAAVAATLLRKEDLSTEPQVNLVSSSFEELFGYSREELTGKSILRLLSLTGMADPQLEIYYNMALHGLGLAPTTGVQVPLRRKTGELVDASVTIQKTVLPGAPGQELLLFHFTDLTNHEEVSG